MNHPSLLGRGDIFFSQADKPFSGAKLRAQERVLQHLQKELSENGFQEGARLPTSRSMAERLGVSVSTVQAVYKKLASEGVISTKVGNGTFLVAPPATAGKGQLKIGVTFGEMAGNLPWETWQLSVSGAIFQRASGLNESISLIPVNLRRGGEEGALGLLGEVCGELDGLIMGLLHGQSKIHDWLRSQDFPVVFLNPPNLETTCDFVAPHHMGMALHASASMVKAGRTRLVLVTAYELSETVVSLLQQYAGMCCAAGAAGYGAVSVECRVASEVSENAGYEVARKLFSENSTIPTGIIVPCPRRGQGVLRYCREAGISVPETVSVFALANDSMDRVDFKGLTVLSHSTRDLGAALLDKLMYMIGTGNRHTPGIYLPFRILAGNSTRKEETAYYQKAMEHSAILAAPAFQMKEGRKTRAG